MKIRFAAVKRAKKFSPNHIENDALILMKTAEELRKLGGEVNFYDEEMIFGDSIKEKNIFSMSREEDVLKRMFELEAKGANIVNSPRAIINCFRENVTDLLLGEGIDYPESKIVNTRTFKSDELRKYDNKKVWIKKEGHVNHREDISLATCEGERDNIIREFARRGIHNAIVQEHLVGDEIKFYGVRGTEFFSWYTTNRVFNTKVDEEKLIDTAHHCAYILDTDVYGGDAIILPDGRISIIDFNDWPSFAPVRDIAAVHIAKRIYDKAESKFEESKFISESA